MARVKIFLRSIRVPELENDLNQKQESKLVQKQENLLALFDSNRGGGINDLVTIVHPGDTVIWKPDCRSGIKRITNIFPKEKDGVIFTREQGPKKRFLARGFKIKIPKDATGQEAYGISYKICDGSEITIDPFLRIPPPGH